MTTTIVLKDKALKDLVKAFKTTPFAKIGVIAGKSNKEGQSIAEYGAKHEYGSPSENLPVRSFLRMPLSLFLFKKLASTKLLDKETLSAVIKSKSLINLVSKIGISAKLVVLEAFDSAGFGRWKPSNMAFKHTKKTLIETQQLRNSIDYEVIAK